MTDLFGEWVDEFDTCNYIARCINLKADAYIWLTKRVEQMREVLELGQVETDDGAESFETLGNIEFRNHYFGFTAESQRWYDQRRMQSADMPAWANGWLSLEPLLGSINYLLLNDPAVKARTKWVVVGCESGPNRRPCKIEWVESIVEQCLAANVPVFVKQICLPNGKFTNKIEEFPAHLQIRQVPWAKEGVVNENKEKE